MGIYSGLIIDNAGRGALSVGVENFEGLIGSYVYVDKSLLVRGLIDRSEYGAVLFCRPRRFGKPRAREPLPHAGGGAGLLRLRLPLPALEPRGRRRPRRRGARPEREDEGRLSGVVVEVKHGRGLDDAALSSLAADALAQARSRPYADALPSGPRLTWGVAFSGKRVAAVCASG